MKKIGGPVVLGGNDMPSPGWNRVHVSENLGATAVASSPLWIMAIRVVEFSNGGYKIRKIFA